MGHIFPRQVKPSSSQELLIPAEIQAAAGETKNYSAPHSAWTCLDKKVSTLPKAKYTQKTITQVTVWPSHRDKHNFTY